MEGMLALVQLVLVGSEVFGVSRWVVTTLWDIKNQWMITGVPKSKEQGFLEESAFVRFRMTAIKGFLAVFVQLSIDGTASFPVYY